MTDLATLYEILDGPMTDKLPPQWALDKVIEVFGEDEYTGTLHAAARLIVAERETRSIELGQLRRRVTAQRRELRRLNKYYMMYWHGYNRGMNSMANETLREKMIKVFGQPAVWAAEHLVMEPALAEVFARVVARWMETEETYFKDVADKIPGEDAAASILPPFSDEHIVAHADAYANRCAEHAYCAAQAAAATAKAYSEFAHLAGLDKAAGYAKFATAAGYARAAAAAAAEYAIASANASPIYLASRAKFNEEYAKYLARPTVRMPNEKTEAEAEADIEALLKVAGAAIDLHRK